MEVWKVALFSPSTMKKSFLKTGQLVTETIVDSTTGEILVSNQKRHTYIANSKEEFLLVYTSLLGVLNDLSAGAIRVYFYLLLHYRPAVPIEIGKKTRDLMATYCGISASNVANSLSELKQKNLVLSNEVKVYYINPRYAFKGDTSGRNKELKALIELGFKDC